MRCLFYSHYCSRDNYFAMLTLPIHIPADGIGASGAGDGDGIPHPEAAFGDAGIGMWVAELESAGTGFVPAWDVCCEAPL